MLARAEIGCWPDGYWVFTPTVDLEGVLAPGTYVLTAEIDVWAAGYCYDSGSLTCYTPASSGTLSAELMLGSASVPALGGPAVLCLALALTVCTAAAARRRAQA